MNRLFSLLLSTLLGSAALASASPAGENCLLLHAKEAYEQNLVRKEQYSAWTDGRSNRIFRSLLVMESLISILARPIDKAAAEFQRHGVNIGCDEFVSIATTPPFKPERTLNRPAKTSFVEIDHRHELRDYRRLLQHNDFEGILAESEVALGVLSRETKLNCLARHFYESIARTAGLAVYQNDRALKKGLPSTFGISKRIITSHVAGIRWAHHIDRLALPLQLEGYPILCQDLPAIPLFESAD